MKKTIAILLLGACLLLPLTSCQACKKDDFGGKPSVSVPVKPQQPTKDPEIDQTDYHKTVTDYFATLANSPEADFTYEATTGGVCVTGYVGTDAAVRIPETLNGQAVVAIADRAFENKKTVKVLYIPDSVVALGKSVLSGSDAIEALHTPLLSEDATKAQHIGYLFGGMGYLDNIKVPASLKYVSLGNAVTEVSDSAFADCDSLVAVVLGDNVKSVGDFAFYYCQKLKYVNMDGLTEIGEFAFASCNVLVRADLGKQTASIGYGAFQGCAALSSMTLPFVGGTQTENTHLGYIFGAEMPDFNAGYIPAYLRTVTVLDSCTSIGNYAFFECASICRVILPDTVTSVGVRAFEKCRLLTEITFSDSLTVIRENAFVGCVSLESVSLGEGLTALGINAFYGCTALKEIALPNSLTKLPTSAFADCRALETVHLGGVLYVGKNAFHNCISLKDLHTENAVFYEDANLIA